MSIDNSLQNTSYPQSGIAQVRINGNNAKNAPVGNDAPAAAASSAPETTDTKEPAKDSVKLSSQYQALGSQVSSSTSFDAKKVAAIKTAIANGEFKIDPEKVAAGLLSTVKDLIGARA
ncbi:flagellar biosynthesis anti-sigma factor FlgM [Herbaspirillum sp. RTI4]|uniref:flagellar biosynthesis anti-sigma factor FlgM n=1 Tax=Herbaspirillum sp. RTI4 TaxID=3048640 RepID=UPI002AB3811A|nr:flagellar biosynthesis anti-sigma factor FlgM [Herbaspirillum sp. RTI4]MDY7578294.1 flagellar biosynthesis anti-sigma factor FlgM [Herbaspirillum sp. RTI4]MEA9981213.1 flagellar biosynthesis anti-sigma factor FlgM [Herbaspirillum sp. RTI4]